MGRSAACVGLIALILCVSQQVYAEAPSLVQMVPKPAWTVCGDFACYTKAEQVKVVQMRAHYELVFNYAVILQNRSVLYDAQVALQAANLATLRAERDNLVALNAIERMQAKEKLKEQSSANTTRLVLYTAGGIGAGILIGMLIASSQ